MIMGKMKSNVILSICVKKFHCAREYVEDNGYWGSPLGSPATKAIRRQLRKKCATIEIRHNDKFNRFKLFFTVPVDRENPDRKLCSVLFESRWILIFSEDRLTDWLLCDSDFSSNLRRLFLWSKGWPTAFWTWQIVYPFPVGYCQSATFSRRGVRHFSNSQPERV